MYKTMKLKDFIKAYDNDEIDSPNSWDDIYDRIDDPDIEVELRDNGYVWCGGGYIGEWRHVYKTREEINEMNHADLLDYAEKLGAQPHETFEESAERFEDSGETEKAAIFRSLNDRWWELES